MSAVLRAQGVGKHFAGILALRGFVDEPKRRATWSAVATVIAFVDVPIVYFSVRWWNSLHQLQSSSDTVSSAFRWPLRLNTIGMILLIAGFIFMIWPASIWSAPDCWMAKRLRWPMSAASFTGT